MALLEVVKTTLHRSVSLYEGARASRPAGYAGRWAVRCTRADTSWKLE